MQAHEQLAAVGRVAEADLLLKCGSCQTPDMQHMRYTVVLRKALLGVLQRLSGTHLPAGLSRCSVILLWHHQCALSAQWQL